MLPHIAVHVSAASVSPSLLPQQFTPARCVRGKLARPQTVCRRQARAFWPAIVAPSLHVYNARPAGGASIDIDTITTTTSTSTTTTTTTTKACLSSNNRSLESLAAFSFLLRHGELCGRCRAPMTSKSICLGTCLPCLQHSRHHTGTQSRASHRIASHRIARSRQIRAALPTSPSATRARALPRTPDGCSSKRSAPPPQGCTSGSVTGGAVGLTIDMLYLLYLSVQRINMAPTPPAALEPDHST
ncbi:hypothetical protein JOL62DRAFT_51902 [Phyllosticta paracitricarpa]|uniref:Uncharacterized protein n=1 Tax=Phyllosticta paracitricarpa TaxID=2016321 RepID=A0ABR1NAZ7_9PEZI